MTRPGKHTARVIAFMMALVLATVTACAPGPTERVAATPEPTHQGNTAPVAADTETVLEVPEGPTVAIPAGAASGDGELSVHQAEDHQGDTLPGVDGWEIELESAKLTGEATITFPLQVQEDGPVPLAGYIDEETGAYVPVDVQLVEGQPTVVTDHFSPWWVQDVGEVTEKVGQTLRGMVDPFPNVERPVCPGADEVGEEVSVTAKKAETYWCVGRNNRGQTIIMVTNREGHAVEFDATPHLVPEVPKTTVSNIVEQSMLLAKTASQQPNSPNTFGLIGPGETRAFTVGGPGKHALTIKASDSTVFATAFRIAVDGLLLMAPISDTLKEGDVAEAILAALDAGSCSLDLWDPTGEAKRQAGGPTVEQITTIATTLLKCSQPMIESRLYEKSLNRALAGAKAAVIGVVFLALGGVTFILSGFSWVMGTVAGDESLVINVARPSIFDQAPSTEVVTVLPFEDGTMENAKMLDTTSVECGGDGLSIRADTTRCIWQNDAPASEAPTLINVCFTDPSGQPRVACPARDGNWFVMKDVGELDFGIPTEKYGNAAPEEGNVFRIELVGGGWCVIASGAGPKAPEGYSGWSGVCEVPGSPEDSVLWAPEEPLDETTPFFTDFSEDGHLQVPIGPENGDPQLYEVARAYR